MQQINCLNLCEILPYLLKKRYLSVILSEAMKEAQFETCERVYIGSSFCGKYFLQQADSTIKELFELCKEKKMKVTLVIPTFSEGDLEVGKRKISHIVEVGSDCVDELTVNDYGMLSYVGQTYTEAINIGRLFMKDYRDPRYEEYYKMSCKPKIFTPSFRAILKSYQIKSVELDLTHRKMDFTKVPKDILLGLHVPYCYQTVGRICEYASIPKEIGKKFRVNDTCGMNCAENLIHYSVTDANLEYVRYGRTIYFKHPGAEWTGIDRYRLIFFPLTIPGESD